MPCYDVTKVSLIFLQVSSLSHEMLVFIDVVMLDVEVEGGAVVYLVYLVLFRGLCLTVVVVERYFPPWRLYSLVPARLV